MRDVVIALIPASVFGFYQFGLRAFVIWLIAVAACVATEYIYQRCMKLPVTVSDGSALVTGILLALNLSSSVPLWLPAVGGVFAVLVVKQLFGGIGQNFMNPALAARCFLLVAFPKSMTSFILDGVASATPLAVLKGAEGAVSNPLASVDLPSMFFGFTGGCIGETSVVAILIGAAYLLA
jgi:Na+-translocating ferredoxin:NAD+ oxidoreductase RnfD subunit